MTSLSKVDIKNFLYFGIILGLCLISIGNFLIPNHIALPNLSTLGIAVICIIIMVINRKIYFSLPVDVLICNSGIVLVFLVGCLIHHENAETTFSYVRFTTVILGYTFTLLFVPSLSKETYKYVIYSFISIVLALSVICIYNFIYYTNHPELTPIAPNTSLIDVIIYQKVVPNNIVYHLFGFFVCFSIILIYWVIYIYKPNLKKIENGILLTLFVYFVIFVTYIGSRNIPAHSNLRCYT